MNNLQHLIKKLQLDPHPEGGFYKRIYESSETIETAQGHRHLTTSIYYLLEKGDFSAWHRIKSDELWYFHEGAELQIHVLLNTGSLKTEILSAENPFVMVPANTWFCSELKESAQEQSFCLVSCVVTPGFDFEDFEMAHAEDLVAIYPQHRNIICRLCQQ